MSITEETKEMSSMEFDQRRRQPFLDAKSYENTLKWFDDDSEILKEKLAEPSIDPRDSVAILKAWALQYWEIFQLRFTAGEDLPGLAASLSQVVESYERVASALDEVPDEQYYPPFVLNDMIDTYVDYLNILSAAALLHREDLIPRICALNEGTEFDESDAVIEEILSVYLPDRPVLDAWYWKAYTPLLDAIDQETPIDRAKAMGKYVKGWYKSMKGVAHFWGKHEEIAPEFSPYYGYWTMCAAALSYLYDIDDSKYRDELVYPKDMIDFARSVPRNAVKLKDGSEILRVLGGQPCPMAGTWFSQAKQDSACQFKKGDLMPIFDSGYGLTTWQLEKSESSR